MVKLIHLLHENMKDYYKELEQFFEEKYPGQLEKLEAIKDNPVEVIRLHNMWRDEIKPFMVLKKYNKGFQ
jgi:hypothetical protein